ncbi:MAG: adenylosuccinate lyase [Candidatus Gracilibacteria bacterium]|jgi:adenylosuccinate lyase|nr:adenylosuccinate lyase [Candidatus Gracilibacteria bacterium]
MKNAISLIDGRNAPDVKELGKYFSEEALIYHRTFVEVKWLLFMSKKDNFPLRKFTDNEIVFLNSLLDNFSESDSDRVKEIEKTTNHDVKSVEIFLREKLSETSLKDSIEYIHFACTSEDINNLSYAIMIKKATEEVMMPTMIEISDILKKQAQDWKSVSMLSRTHGQPATPGTVGKELLVFAYRLDRQIARLENQEFLGKFSGATGNFAVHKLAVPEIEWIDFSREFIEEFDLKQNFLTTQIESHDFVAELSNTMTLANTIMIDLARDVWTMISFNFFKQKVVKGEVGSSTMPHKVNPIDFENAEGNFGLANSLFTHFSQKLPISRLQRDLSDSTVFRSVGTAFAHMLLSLKKLKKGLLKLELNEKVVKQDLANNPEVLAEAVQTIMRKYGVENPYDKLKSLTRGKRMSLEDFYAFVDTLEIPNNEKVKLKDLTPDKYIGLSEELVDRYLG